MQASSRWTPPTGALGTLTAEARVRVEALRAREAELRRLASGRVPGPSLAAVLRSSAVAVIAELKRSSPSKGNLNPGLRATDRAFAYVEGGAAAISVLTEPAHFGGSPTDLDEVARLVGVPTLKKDFHVDPVQLVEARALGASAVLLIARALAPADLEELARVAAALDLETLIEIRSESELERALGAGTTMVGVNSRDLETLKVEPETGRRLLRLIPATVVAVAESGVRDRRDVERAAEDGADAVLVGSALSPSTDPVGAVRALAGVARRSRAH